MKVLCLFLELCFLCICGRSINSKDEERMRGGRRPRVGYSPKVRKNRNSSGKHSFEIAKLGDGQEEDDHTAPTKKKTKMAPSEQRSCVPSPNAEEILEEKVCVFYLSSHIRGLPKVVSRPQLWCCQKREKVQQQTGFLLVVPNAVSYGLRVEGLGSCFVQLTLETSFVAMQLRSRILHNEEEEKELEANHGTSRSYFRVKEGNGPSKKSVNKISDIGVVEEQVNCDPNPFLQLHDFSDPVFFAAT